MSGRTLMQFAIVCLIGALPVRAGAQIPDTFTNLQVLPKDISKPELMEAMKGFSSALGVRCVSCHVGEDGPGFAGFDFASDEKEDKRTARLMLRMVHDINNSYLSELDEPPSERVTVECVTCHRGQKHPRMLADVLAKTAAEQGVDSAVAQYHSLRERYYGSHTFDFSELTLLRVADGRSMADDTDGAVALAELNREMFPESFMTMYQLGEAYAAAGRKDDALKQFEACQKLMPNPHLTKRIEELKSE